MTRHHVLKNNTNNHQDSSLIRVIPEASVDSITVPGAAAGWMDTIEWFGSGKLTLADILAPAIRIAEEGFQVQPICAGMWQRYIGKLSHYNSSSSTNADAGGMSSSAPVAGQIVRNHTLATSFRLLASQGIQEAFYSEKGSIAQSIIDTIQAHGGVMTMEYSTGMWVSFLS